MTVSGPLGFSDAARRVSDTLRQAIVDGHRGQWMAFAIEDGASDGMCYLTRPDAIHHHTNKARLFMYVQVPWDDCPVLAAEAYLRLHRQLADIGQHVADDELPDTQWMFDNRREAYPQLDARRVFAADRHRQRRGERRTPGGLIISDDHGSTR